MSQEYIVKTFCTVLVDFLDDLYQSYPDPNLFLLKQTSKAMIGASPRSLVENFMSCVEPYKDKLLNRDESFFMNGGLTANLHSTQYSFLVDELNKISEIWNRPETSKKTKDGIWKYFQILVNLGSKLT